MWMLVPGAGSHGALVLSSTRKWFQTPQQNSTKKELTGDRASSAKQPRALEADDGLSQRWVQMATEGQLWGSQDRTPKLL